jgi:hypothetical protein
MEEKREEVMGASYTIRMPNYTGDDVGKAGILI